MEEHSVVKKRSVAELAGKFSCPVSHMTDTEVNKPVRRRPPRSLPLPAGNDAGQGQDEKGVSAETVSTRKNRNSALIEKLQASLTLSPTGPPPFPKSPGVVKLPVPPFFPGSPSSPSSPPAAVTPKKEETPASFEGPAEGNVLKSINKGRARHSIKRRPPSRRHRKSSADEGGEEVDKTATLDQTTPNGHEGDVFEEHKTSPDTESLSSKEQIEQETKSTDSEKPELETVTSEKEEGEEKEEKTEPEEKEEKTEPEEKKEKAEPETKEEKTEPETKEEKTEPETKEKKTEPETKEETSEDEPQLANSTEETREEPVTQPQTEPDTTDEKEEEQKENEVNH